MRERLDCAMLELGDMADWHMPDEGIYSNGRLHLHHIEPPPGSDDASNFLAAMALFLQRYDACLLAVSARNLFGVRQALLAAQDQLHTPIIVMAHELTAPAIDDLYHLGVSDFIRDPICAEELRIRIERALNQRGSSSARRYPDTVAGQGYMVSDAVKSGAASTTWYGKRHLQQSITPESPSVTTDDKVLEALAIASVSRCADSSESFRMAKNKMVERFERAYLLASLAKSSGNIAKAARGAKKHRRAYWALMRKYDIDAAPFRKGVSPD